MTAMPIMELDADATGTLSHEAIEQMLHAIWDDLTKADTTHRTRVRTLNLLIFVPDTPSDQFRSQIARAALAHPGRTITIQPSGGIPHAEVTVACRVGGSSEACSEQIMLRGGDTGGQPLLSLALALLHPGLPVALWWYGAPHFDRGPFTTMLEIAEHVFVDSRTWPEPAEPLRQLAEIRARLGATIRFSDFQWVALTPWRQQLAQAFDGPLARSILPSVHEVIIRYDPTQHVVGSWLLASWLMKSLGWELADGPVVRDQAGLVVPLTAAGRPMSLALQPAGQDHSISGVTMNAATSRQGSFTCEMLPDGTSIKTSIAMPGSPPLDRVTPALHMPMGRLIDEELALGNNDPVYTRTLDVALQLAAKIRGSL